MQINAWELGAGVGTQAWAWVIMLMGFFLGAVLAPGQTFAAFARGRRSDNLYAGPLSGDLLDQDLDALRGQLGVTGPVAPSARDALHFGGALLGATAVAAALLPALLLLIAHGSVMRLEAAWTERIESGMHCAHACPFTALA